MAESIHVSLASLLPGAAAKENVPSPSVGDLGDGRTFYLETFGCQMNEHDSEKVAGALVRRGYRQVASPDEENRSLLKYISDDEENWPSRLLERSELQRLLADAIDKIPRTERTVITLYYHEELTLREISKIVNLHESRVSQLKSQAILRLRSYVEKRWPMERGA